jgi:peptide/nickel transport system substrate-binding protein
MLSMTNNRWLRLSVILLALTLVIVVAAGCTTGEEEAQEAEGESAEEPESKEEGKEEAKEEEEDTGPKKGGTVVFARRDAPTTLDPHKHGQASASVINSMMGGSLVARNPWTKEIEPLHAKSWEISEDGVTYTFKLREDIKFHNGEPLTAHDYKWTYERALDPETAAVQSAGFLGAIEKMEVPDDYTFVVTIKEPSAVFLGNMAMTSYLQPLEQGYVEEQGDAYGRNPIGMGPWKFEEWITGESITLVRNEEFAWGESWFENQGPPYLEKLVYKYLPEEATMLAALEAGQVDIAQLPAHAVQTFEDNPDFEVASNLQMGMGRWFMPNLQKEVWQDKNVRLAIAHALDRQFFIETSMEGRAVPAYSILSPPMLGYYEKMEELAPKYDLEKSQQLLEEAGWTDEDGDGIREKDGKKLEILLLTRTEELQMRDAEIAQSLLQEIGVAVKIESFERALHTEKCRAGEHDLSIGQYWWSSGDPDVLSFFFHSSQTPGGLNTFHLVDEKVDELLEKGQVTLDEEERWGYYHELQELIVTEGYAFPVYISKEYSAVSKRIKDWKANPSGGILIRDAWIAE